MYGSTAADSAISPTASAGQPAERMLDALMSGEDELVIQAELLIIKLGMHQGDRSDDFGFLNQYPDIDCIEELFKVPKNGAG